MAKLLSFENLLELGISITAKMVLVLCVFVSSWFIAGLMKGWSVRHLSKTPMDLTLVRFLGNVSRYGVLMFGFLACLGIFGIQTTSFAAILGASSLAVGLAFQGSLSHLAAGFMLMIFRPFRVSDVIVVQGHEGMVEEIELFSTALRTKDHIKVIIPNGAVFGSTILNMSAFSPRRVDILVPIPYTISVETAKSMFQHAIDTVMSDEVDVKTEVVMKSFLPQHVEWHVKVWSRNVDYSRIQDEMMFAIKIELEKYSSALSVAPKS